MLSQNSLRQVYLIEYESQAAAHMVLFLVILIYMISLNFPFRAQTISQFINCIPVELMSGEN